MAVALTITLFLVLRHRRNAARKPQPGPFGPEAGFPYMPRDVITQSPISPTLSSQQTHQKLYVSPRSAINFELYQQPRLSCV